jgi:chemotaxis protein MotB
MDKSKYKQFAGSLEKAFGVQRKVKAMEIPKGVTMVARDFNQDAVQTHRLEELLVSQMERVIAEELERPDPSSAKDRPNDPSPEKNRSTPKEKDKAIQVVAGNGEVKMRIMGEASFDTGKADLRADIKPILARVASILNNHPGDIMVAGHTDNVPLVGGPYRSNLGLSMARSAAVAEYLIAMAGVKPERITTQGSGEYKPLASNSTEEGRRRNRRVEIIFKPSPAIEPLMSRK